MTGANLQRMTDRVVGKLLPIETPERPKDARAMSQRVAYLLSDDHESLPGAASILELLNAELSLTLGNAFEELNSAALLELHKSLFAIYEVSFCDPLSPSARHEYSPWVINFRNAVEAAWLKYEMTCIGSDLPTPSEMATAESLCGWFTRQARKETALDQRVVRFLAEEATREQFKTFMLADAHLNYRFYDAMALVQKHYSESVKAEISRHMWDECGEGLVERAHTAQFTRALMKMGLGPPATPIWNDWRPYAGYNLYLCFGLSRQHYFKAVGSLTMPELFDPARDQAVVAGLDRLGFNAQKDFEYYYNHIGGDEAHGQRWLERVITPIALAQPEAVAELAIGGALRMEAMRRYNQYLAKEFALG